MKRKGSGPVVLAINSASSACSAVVGVGDTILSAERLETSEQVVKNYLRTAFDKLGVWTRLELALYVAGHGGANWHVPPGNGLLPASSEPASAPREAPQFSDTKTRDRSHELGNQRPSVGGGQS